MTDIVQRLEAAAERSGLAIVERGHGHFQIRGGAFLVNYYPLSRWQTAYVDATKQGINGCSPERAVEMALVPPRINTGARTYRRDSYKAVRKRLFKRQKHCHWCSVKMILECNQPNSATIEHIVPLARGGLDNDNNRKLACLKCNSARGCDMPEVAQR